jgi:VWFA-related protein
VFLIVLGRGKLQEPSKGMDAILHFVREQLLPQDQVAVFAYDRATDFTTNHEEIAKILERFKRMHQEIDFEIGLQVTSGLAAIYGSKAIPRKLQSQIDLLFEGSPLVASHPVTPRIPASATDDARRQAETLQRQQTEKVHADMDADAGLPHATLWNEQDVIESSQFTDLTFDEFIEANAQTLQDLGNCYAGIEYLRHIEGEKHLVFVTEKGMFLPRTDDDEALARAANDARVALDTIQTGGIYIPQAGGAPVNSWSETFAFQALHNVSDWTGGVSSVMKSGQAAVDQLNDATRTGYVLGYYPTNATFDGTYRKINVKVRAPGATVLYRHGYYARLELLPFDRRGFITQDRILAALAFGRTVNDIKLKLDASLARSETGEGRDLVLSVRIDPSRLSFRTTADGSHLGLIDIAVFCFDQKEHDQKAQMLHNSWQKAELKFTEAVFQTIKRDGIPYQARIPVPAAVRNIRVIVYDYKADLVGSVDGKVI